MIINQNVLVILRTFLNLQKKFIKKLCTKEEISKAPTTELFSKFSNRKEMSNEPFDVCEIKIYSDEAIKSYKSHTNNKSRGNDLLTADFYKHF